MPPETPEQWLPVLEQRLTEQQAEIKLFEQYFAGEHRMAFATTKFRMAFGSLFKAFADNWCQTIVEAPVERLIIEGFRFGDTEQADSRAWEIWQANSLDADSAMAHTEAVKDGKAFLLVEPPAESGGNPRITVEHASQVVVACSGANRRERVAALKKWHDDSDEFEYATLYLPDQIVKWRSSSPVKTGRNKIKWEERPEDPGGGNPLGIVPVVPLLNNPTMLSGGRSDLETAIPIQDAINKELADMLVASEFAAFMQRWATGVEVPTDDDGQPVPVVQLKAALSGMLAVPNKDAKFGQFEASQLSNYTGAVETLLQHLAAQTRTPPHYLIGKIVNSSGDALKAAETGLVAKVKRKQLDFAEGWEEAMRLAFLAAGEPKEGADTAAETIWRDAEYRSEAEQADAAIKKAALGIPKPALWEMVGATPKQIEQWKQLRETEREEEPEAPPAEPVKAEVRESTEQ